jgi:hypothetical protein
MSNVRNIKQKVNYKFKERKWLKLFMCQSCSYCFGNFETKWTACANCSCEDVYEIAPTWADVTYLEDEKN